MYRNRIAIDLAKDVFHLAEANAQGAIVARKRLTRAAFTRYLQALEAPAVIIMEACGTAHYWGRLCVTLGHDVKLLHARYVKPYRQRNKTDRNDCDAILEAARAHKMHPVPIKSELLHLRHLNVPLCVGLGNPFSCLLFLCVLHCNLPTISLMTVRLITLTQRSSPANVKAKSGFSALSWAFSVSSSA